MEYPDFPRAAVGVIVLRENDSGVTEVLLVQRAKAPSRGMWALPGGSVELGETLEQAAEREVYEETGIEVRAGHVVHAFDAIERDVARRVAYHYVIVDVIAEYLAGRPEPGSDALAAAWFSANAVAEMSVSEVSQETRRLVSRLMRR